MIEMECQSCLDIPAENCPKCGGYGKVLVRAKDEPICMRCGKAPITGVLSSTDEGIMYCDACEGGHTQCTYCSREALGSIDDNPACLTCVQESLLTP